MKSIDKSVLLIGVGGLGCPAALALVRAGVRRLLIADDDEVELTNLHRQILFNQEDVGQPKPQVAQQALEAERASSSQRIELVGDRFLPGNCLHLAGSVDLILEGSDNFATKFLAADTCRLAGKPIVHGAAVRWRGTVLPVAPGGAPCYRCLFEDLPGGDAAPNCAEAGVMGPVVGLVGALMAEHALRILCHPDEPPYGAIATYDGKVDQLRSATVWARTDCPLCGKNATIKDINESRYLAPGCAA